MNNSIERPAPFSCTNCPDVGGRTAWFKTAEAWEEHLKRHDIIFVNGRPTKKLLHGREETR